eukprot:948034_1
MAQNTEPSDDSKTKERAAKTIEPVTSNDSHNHSEKSKTLTITKSGTGTHTRSAPGSITAMTKTKSLSNRSNQISINATKHTHTHTHNKMGITPISLENLILYFIISIFVISLVFSKDIALLVIHGYNECSTVSGDSEYVSFG